MSLEQGIRVGFFPFHRGKARTSSEVGPDSQGFQTNDISNKTSSNVIYSVDSTIAPQRRSCVLVSFDVREQVRGESSLLS